MCKCKYCLLLVLRVVFTLVLFELLARLSCLNARTHLPSLSFVLWVRVGRSSWSYVASLVWIWLTRRMVHICTYQRRYLLLVLRVSPRCLIIVWARFLLERLPTPLLVAFDCFVGASGVPRGYLMIASYIWISANFVHPDPGWPSFVPVVVGAVWFCSLCFVIARALCLLQRPPPALLVAFDRFVGVSTVHLGSLGWTCRVAGLDFAELRASGSRMAVICARCGRCCVVICFMIGRAALCLLQRSPPLLVAFDRFVGVLTVHIGVLDDGHAGSRGWISANFVPDCCHLCSRCCLLSVLITLLVVL